MSTSLLAPAIRTFPLKRHPTKARDGGCAQGAVVYVGQFPRARLAGTFPRHAGSVRDEWSPRTRPSRAVAEPPADAQEAVTATAGEAATVTGEVEGTVYDVRWGDANEHLHGALVRDRENRESMGHHEGHGGEERGTTAVTYTAGMPMRRSGGLEVWRLRMVDTEPPQPPPTRVPVLTPRARAAMARVRDGASSLSPRPVQFVDDATMVRTLRTALAVACVHGG